MVTDITSENATSHPEQTLAHRAVAAIIRASDELGRMLPGGTSSAGTRRLERFLQPVPLPDVLPVGQRVPRAAAGRRRPRR